MPGFVTDLMYDGSWRLNTWSYKCFNFSSLLSILKQCAVFIVNYEQTNQRRPRHIVLNSTIRHSSLHCSAPCNVKLWGNYNYFLFIGITLLYAAKNLPTVTFRLSSLGFWSIHIEIFIRSEMSQTEIVRSRTWILARKNNMIYFSVTW